MEKDNQRNRTYNIYNLDFYNHYYVDGKYQMPIIDNNNIIPTELIGFNYAKTEKNKNKGIHFYLDDYQFERIWNNPLNYIDVLKEYLCVLSPDFSLYLDMPMPMKIWNVYRSRMIGQMLQNYGIKVIPTLSWAEKETYEFCFDGIPEGSIVSVSSIGVKKDKEAMEIWKDGMDYMIKKIKPKAILVYGGKIDYDYGNTKVYYYKNSVTEKLEEKRMKLDIQKFGGRGTKSSSNKKSSSPSIKQEIKNLKVGNYKEKVSGETLSDLLNNSNNWNKKNYSKSFEKLEAYGYTIEDVHTELWVNRQFHTVWVKKMRVEKVTEKAIQFSVINQFGNEHKEWYPKSAITKIVRKKKSGK